MRNYKQLSQGQRYQIEILLKAGHDQKEIARQLKVSPGIISRELKRNKGKRGYRPQQAQIKMDQRRNEATKALKMTEDVIHLVVSQLKTQ